MKNIILLSFLMIAVFVFGLNTVSADPNNCNNVKNPNCIPTPTVTPTPTPISCEPFCDPAGFNCVTPTPICDPAGCHC